MEQKQQQMLQKTSSHSCSYCGIQDQATLIQCKICERHFCNNKIGNNNQTDIILHLSNSGHTKVATFGKSSDYAFEPKCEECPTTPETSVFKLRLFWTDHRFRILCNACAKARKIMFDRDVESIIREKRLPYKFAEISCEKILKNVVILTEYQTRFLERSWKIGVNPSLLRVSNLQSYLTEQKGKSIKKIYEDKFEYINDFDLLITEEERCSKERFGLWYQDGVTVEFEIVYNKCYALLTAPQDCYFSIRLSAGDQLELSSKEWEGTGIVKYARENKIELLILDQHRTGKLRSVRVKYVWVDTPYIRLQEALNKFTKDDFNLSGCLASCLLQPPEIDQNFTEDKNEILTFEFPDGFPKLNIYQRLAVTRALDKFPITLIQGPPGTGKTETLTALLYEINKRIVHKRINDKILVCAPSNTAVDHLAERLHAIKLDVCRMYSRRKEALDEVNPELSAVSLNEMILSDLGEESQVLRKYADLKRRNLLTVGEEKKFNWLKLKAEQKVLKRVRIVCCTCMTAADRRLDEIVKAGCRFTAVIIDEAAQALEPESLLPLFYGTEKLILAGDHKQLNPLVLSTESKACGLGISLFERLAHRLKPVVLLTQYRMHPEIAYFPSKNFYGGQLRNSASVEKPVHKNFSWPNPLYPTFFYNIKGREEMFFGETFFNRHEAQKIQILIKELIKSGIKPSSIAVLTPYNGQLLHLYELQEEKMIHQNIEISSIDGFQGREKEYIILSCVRSNKELGLGFLNNKRRLNVALTRAKQGLFIFGNAKFLATGKCPLWRGLINHYMDKGVLVSGEIGKWDRTYLKY